MILPALWPSSRYPSILLGSVPFLGFLRAPYRLPLRDLKMHLHVMGITGQGKSKFIASVAAQCIEHGFPVAIIDPHTDLANDTTRLLLQDGFFNRKEAQERFWYVDFTR